MKPLGPVRLPLGLGQVTLLKEFACFGQCVACFFLIALETGLADIEHELIG